MSVIQISKIQVRRGQENQTGIPQLDAGEFGWAEDTEHLYIGKRMVNGAPDDNNSRILTENDLNNIFALANIQGAAVATTSSYRYRDDVSPDIIHSTVTTIARKLDSTVSLIDFGLVPSVTATDITTIITDAVHDIFDNEFQGADARRELIIPAGTYYITDVVDLPPYSTLRGEGSSLTTLILTNESTNLFRTVDSSGSTYEDGMTNSRATQPRNIRIEGMTLRLDATSTQALLALDNVYNAVIKDVKFSGGTTSSELVIWEEENIEASPSTGTELDLLSIDTLTYPYFLIDPSQKIWYVTGTGVYSNVYARLESITMVGDIATFELNSPSGGINFASTTTELVKLVKFNGWGQGISIRGQYGDNASDAGKLSANIQIRECEFKNLYTGVLATGTVSRTVIENNIFGDSIYGVSMYHDDNAVDANILIGPTNGIITENRFQNIAREALFVGANPNDYQSSHLSSHNHFVQVGNDIGMSDSNVTTSSYSVITYESPGNKSYSDHFNRRTVATGQLAGTAGAPFNSAYYYNPLVSGNTSIEDNSTYNVTALAGDVTNVYSMPYTAGEQTIRVRYQMSTDIDSLSRKGDLLINLTNSNEFSMSETYTFIENMSSLNASTDNMVALDGSNLDVLVVADTASSLGALISVTGATSNYYITGSDVYLGLTALILSVTFDGSTYTVITQSSGPQFDFSTLDEEFTVIYSNTPLFTLVANNAKNYVTVVCDATNSLDDLNIEYQTNVLV
jgi:hypothetical protein